MNATLSRFSIRPARWAQAVVLLLALGALGRAPAADFYWTDASASGDFTNSLAWAGAGVPGPADNAIFTFNLASPVVNWTSTTATSNAFFSAQSGTVTLSNAAWTVLDRFAVGQGFGSTAAVVLASGTLAVTNAEGNAAALVGQAGVGTFTLAGGTLIADRLYATNGAYSVLQLRSGTLVTLSHTTITTPADFTLGGGGTLNWSMAGGTNVTTSTGVILLGTNSGRALVAVSGAGTLWSNSATWFNIGGTLSAADENQLTVSNGAHVVVGDMGIGGSPTITAGQSGSYSNRVVVSGDDSVLDAGGIVVGTRTASGQRLIVTNGGLVRATNIVVGQTQTTGDEGVIVTGPGSRLLVGGNLNYNSGLNFLSVLNGGFVSNSGSASFGVAQTAMYSSNSVLVVGVGSTWVVGGTLRMGAESFGNTMVISNGGYVLTLGTATLNGTAGRGASNSVLVSDGGTLWSVAGGVTVGAASTVAGSLVVSNGAALFTGGASWMSGSNGLTLVTGTGSTWTNNGAFGVSGFSNVFRVVDGATLAGTGGITLASASSSVVLGNTNTYSGATVFTSGSLLVSNALALQNSTLTYSNGVRFGSGITAFTLGGLAGGASTLGLTNADGAAITLTVGNNHADTTFSGLISGGGALVKVGTGALTLNTNNTFTGGTIISNGAVIAGVTANTVFGTGKVMMVSGAILAASNGSPDTLLGVLDPTSSGTFALAANTASNLNFASRGLSNLFYGAYRGTYTNGGTFTPYGTTYQLGGGGGTLVYSNAIGGASNLVVGPAGGVNSGTVLLSGSNTFSGGVTLQSGALQLGTVLSAGSGDYTAAGGSLSGLAGVSNRLVLNSDLSLFGAGWGGHISGAGRLLLTNFAQGTFTLAGSNTYSGGTLLGGVNLAYASSNAFSSGVVVVGTNVVFSGTVGLVIGNPIQVAGPTFAVMTAGSIFSGAMDLMGQTNVTLGLGNGVNANRIFSLLGPITNGVNLIVRQAPFFATAIGANPTSGAMLGGSNTWSGITLVDSHTLQLVSNYGGIFTSTNLIVAGGGTLSLNNLGTPGVSRLDPGAQVVLSNGVFQVIGPGTAGLIFTQQVGAVTVASGANTLWTTNRGTFAMADLFRSGSGTLNLIGTNSAAIAIAVGGAPAELANGVVPWITVNGGDFASWSGGQLGGFNSYVYNTTSLELTNDATVNLKLTNNGTVATTFLANGPSAINSLVVASNSAALNLGGNTLTIGSGAILSPGIGLLITNGAVNFGSVQGLVNNAGALTNFASFDGSGGLAKSGAGALVLLGTNAWQGDTVINQGSLVLGPGGSVSNSGALNIGVGASFVLSNASATVGGISLVSNTFGIGTMVLGGGALTTTSNSTLQAAVTLGPVAAGSTTWQMTGGSNTVFGITTIGGVAGASGNMLLVGGGATLDSMANVTIGTAGSFGNGATVAGSNTVWTMRTGTFMLGSAGSTNSSLFVTNGGRLAVNGAFNVGSGSGASSATLSNLIVVAGSGSTISNNGAATFQNGAGLRSGGLIVTNGGAFIVTGAFNLIGTSNRVVVSDSNSLVYVGGDFFLGKASGTSDNVLVVSNGATVFANRFGMAQNTSTLNNSTNSTVVTGTNTLFQTTLLALGGGMLTSLAQTNNFSTFLVNDGATLEATGIQIWTNKAMGGLAGVISNQGGVYQFTSSSPTITVQTNATAGGIRLVDGWISYRGATNVDIRGNQRSSLTNIVFAGNNLFRLNGAGLSNAGQAYVFDNTLGTTNFVGLEMVNGATLWQGGSLTISNNGTMLVSNTSATVAGILTNLATIRVAAGSVTWVSNVVMGGNYLAQGATSTFSRTTIVGPSASVIADASSPVSIGGSYANLGASVFSNRVTITSGGSYAPATNTAANSFVGGLLNRGLLLAVSNGTINIGGLDQASAMASLATFTNDVGGTNFVGSPAAAGFLNASTNGIGYLNLGLIQNYAVAGHWSTGFVKATVYNDVGGAIGASTPSSYNRYLTLYSVPTNAGTIQIVDGAFALAISQGDLVNQGVIRFGVDRGNFTLANGALINDSNGSVFLSATLNTPNLARSTWNRGTIVVSNYNNGAGYTANFGGGITNDGTIRLYAAPNAVVGNDTLGASNLVNRGTVMAIGYLDGLTNAFRLIRIGNGAAAFAATPVTNQLSGVILATNGAALAINGAFRNDGTLVVHSNSTLGVGSVDNAASVMVGSLPFSNPGTITLVGGTFGASILTNTGTLQGHGSVGRSTLTNLTLGAASNMVRQFAANNPIINTGAILPSGTLNAGAISNLAGGLIAGYGTISSSSTTNFYDAATNLVTQTTSTGAQVYNAPGATLLADGGTLVLENGLLGGTQTGTLGTTNGGILRIGNGTGAFTNSGSLTLGGGALEFGTLYSSGTLQGTGTVRAGSVTNAGTLAPGFSPGALSFTNDLTLLTSSLLVLEIAGTNAGAWDFLSIGGLFSKDGTVLVTNLGYTFTGGETFDFFDAGSLGGAFDTTLLPELNGGMIWDTSLFESQGILSVMPIPEPSSLIALGAGVLVLLAHRRRGA